MKRTFGLHLRVQRAGYWHHAVYVGDGRVIHFSGLTKDKATATIRHGTLQDFAARGDVEIVRYARAFPAEVVVQRAVSRLGQSGYDVFGNNCEHFARWCLTGEHRSWQAERLGAGAAGAGGSTALAAGAVGGVVAVGETLGLAGGAGIMHGLAATGGAVGAGAAGGLAVLATAPAAATTLAMRHAYRDDVMLPLDERRARKAARDSATVAAVGGTLGSVALVSAVGVPGLSAIGITTGLAGIGAAVGGGMLAGVAVAVGGPAALVWLLGRLAYAVKKK
jgi:hypothetical protein